MSKSNHFIKNLNNITKIINNLLEKNLNKLNFRNLRNLTKNNKIILTFVAFLVLFISYLLLPTFYKNIEVSSKLESELNKKLRLNFNISQNISYNFFPKPHFIISDATITSDKNVISKIKKLKIFLAVNTLFSLNNIEVNNVLIENANFNLNKQNYNFFLKILDNNFLEDNFKIINSTIFFRNQENEVLFINKILDLKYFYDSKELKNIALSKNEVFNLPYTIKLFHSLNERKYYSKLNLDFFKIQIENIITYREDIKNGKANIINNKNKSVANYKIHKNFLEFNFFDKAENPIFLYNGIVNFNPFYSNFEGNSEKIILNYFLDADSVVIRLLKTELFNNKNIDFKLKFNAEKINNYFNFNKISISSKIQEGLIDVDNTSFNWKNFAEFKLSESLIYVKDGELVLDGKFKIYLKNYNEIYKFLLTPKNNRNKIEYIDFNFTYNFDQKIASLKDIKIDNKLNFKINKILGSIMFKESSLQNKIYFKNLLNEAIKSYDG